MTQLTESSSPIQLPVGWTEAFQGGIITNSDPVNGGIIDTEIVSGEWFVIPNNDAILTISHLDSRADALKALEMAVAHWLRIASEKTEGQGIDDDDRSLSMS